MNEETDIRTPGFTVLRPLAHGRTTSLLEVRDDATGARYGLCVLRKVSGSETTRLRDATASLRALEHPNVARLVAVQRTDAHASLLVGLVEGPTLAQAMDDEPFTAEQADDLGRGILQGLEALHAAGITHPRLGPDDVLLSVGATGPVARIVGAGVVTAIEGTARDVREDVRAAGLLLHGLLSGHFADPEETLTELGPDVPERLTKAVIRALRVDVDQRAQSAREVLAVWEGSGEPGTERIAPARAWDDRAVQRLRRLWSDVTPVVDTWEDLPTNQGLPKPASEAPVVTTTMPWLPGAIVAGLLGFVALIAWWTS